MGLSGVPRKVVNMSRLTAVALLLALCTACQPGGTPAAANGGVTAEAPAPTAPRTMVPAPAADATARFDPDLMHVTLFGERLLIEDSGHSWPVYLDKSTKALVLRGMAPFGTPKASVGPDDCPAGKLEFLDYPNGLQLAFQDDTLVGYWVREGAQGVATERGVHPGTPRSALGDASIIEASFGFLADLDGVIAILDERKSQVTDLYAGAACIYD